MRERVYERGRGRGGQRGRKRKVVGESVGVKESNSRKEQKLDNVEGRGGGGESKMVLTSPAADDDDVGCDDADVDDNYNDNHDNSAYHNGDDSDNVDSPTHRNSPRPSLYPSGLPILPNEARDLSAFLLHSSYDDYRRAVWEVHGGPFDR